MSAVAGSLVELKTEIKQWERAFRKAHGKIPSKADIDACPDILQKYKEYQALKKSGQSSTKAVESQRGQGENLPSPVTPRRRASLQKQQSTSTDGATDLLRTPTKRREVPKTPSKARTPRTPRHLKTPSKTSATDTPTTPSRTPKTPSTPYRHDLVFHDSLLISPPRPNLFSSIHNSGKGRFLFSKASMRSQSSLMLVSSPVKRRILKAQQQEEEADHLGTEGEEIVLPTKRPRSFLAKVQTEVDDDDDRAKRPRLSNILNKSASSPALFNEFAVKLKSAGNDSDESDKATILHSGDESEEEKENVKQDVSVKGRAKKSIKSTSSFKPVSNNFVSHRLSSKNGGGRKGWKKRGFSTMTKFDKKAKVDQWADEVTKFQQLDFVDPSRDIAPATHAPTSTATTKVDEVVILPEEETAPTGYSSISQRYGDVEGSWIDMQERDSRVYAHPEAIVRRVFKLQQFRTGQLEAVEKILAAQRTLVSLPTGAGKSLCYQLPSYIISNIDSWGPSLTLVISPTLSLMQDQIRQLPPELPGTTLEGMKSLCQMLANNTYKVLFITPEKLSTPSFLRFCKSGKIPPIKLVCIDEAHCLLEWSHTFRPCYRLLPGILNDLDIPSILAMSGTLTNDGKRTLCDLLDIDPESGVVEHKELGANLRLSCSHEPEQYREQALLDKLKEAPFANLTSILIYVSRKEIANALAKTLQIRGYSADAYHSDKTSEERERLQQDFLNGGIRILVATVAFSMGFNKLDLRSVIHYNMPSSLEQYVQEISRCGRDGAEAYCHLFFHDFEALRWRNYQLAYRLEDSMVQQIAVALLQGDSHQDRCKPKSLMTRSQDGTQTLIVAHEKLAQEFGIDQQWVLTILDYLQADSSKFLTMSSKTYKECHIYVTKRSMEEFLNKHADLEDVFKLAFASDNKRQGVYLGRAPKGAYIFDTQKMCKLLRLSFEQLAERLQELNREIRFEFHVPAVVLEVSGSESDSEEAYEGFMEAVLDRLVEKVRECEARRVYRIDALYAAVKMASESYHDPESLLRDGITAYFENPKDDGTPEQHGVLHHLKVKCDDMEPEVEQAVTEFIRRHGLAVGARAIARILHGIPSGKDGYQVWDRDAWKRCEQYDLGRTIAAIHKAQQKYAREL